MQRTLNGRAGFTLVELLAVIVIIGILAAGIFMLVRTASSRAAIAKTTAQVHAIASLVEEYKNLYGHYPVAIDADAAGYCEVNYTFKVEDGGSCSQCGNQTSNGGVLFGLCSNFIPVASRMEETTRGTNMRDRLAASFKQEAGSQEDEDIWEKKFGANRNADMFETVRNEKADQNLQALYRSYRRLHADGMVTDEVFLLCPYCGTQKYIGGVNGDAWGNALKYRVTGGAGEIVSAGPDGAFGTGDDISSGGAAVNEDED